MGKEYPLPWFSFQTLIVIFLCDLGNFFIFNSIPVIVFSVDGFSNVPQNSFVNLTEAHIRSESEALSRCDYVENGFVNLLYITKLG